MSRDNAEILNNHYPRLMYTGKLPVTGEFDQIIYRLSRTGADTFRLERSEGPDVFGKESWVTVYRTGLLDKKVDQFNEALLLYVKATEGGIFRPVIQNYNSGPKLEYLVYNNMEFYQTK